MSHHDGAREESPSWQPSVATKPPAHSQPEPEPELREGQSFYVFHRNLIVNILGRDKIEWEFQFPKSTDLETKVDHSSAEIQKYPKTNRCKNRRMRTIIKLNQLLRFSWATWLSVKSMLRYWDIYYNPNVDPILVYAKTLSRKTTFWANTVKNDCWLIFRDFVKFDHPILIKV